MRMCTRLKVRIFVLLDARIYARMHVHTYNGNRPQAEHMMTLARSNPVIRRDLFIDLVPEMQDVEDSIRTSAPNGAMSTPS
jgi:hypothetical protein